MDDGYIDQATVGAPLFAEFDCPVTTFVTTGFLDRQLWFWWDKIRYVFLHTRRRQLSVVLDDTEVRYRWDANGGTDHARRDFTERAKDIPDAEKEAAIRRLAAAAEVDLPESAPLEYSPMSWDEVRACEEKGMTFGPHSVTHPILARTIAERSRREIVDSWARLCAEAHRPLPVFAYPNGRWVDFGEHEIATLKSLEFLGAVAAMPGYNDAASFRAQADARYKLRRFGKADSLPHVTQVLSRARRFR
jgi:peptidoglycan/xylan/chitin deacetylase (PgdA/CDA1 family)